MVNNIEKESWKPGTMIYPLPAVLVSCGKTKDEYNLITIAWTGTINSNPPMCYISVRPERYSYDIIKKNMEFVINLTTKSIAKATDWCGVKSGRDFDKFKETGLTPIDSEKISTVAVAESPINIECVVKNIIKLGSHDMFISEVVNVRATKKYFDENDAFNLNKTGLMAYSHGHYYELGGEIGRFGNSVKKKK